MLVEAFLVILISTMENPNPNLYSFDWSAAHDPCLQNVSEWKGAVRGGYMQMPQLFVTFFIYLFDIEHFIFLRETPGDFEKWCLQQSIVLPCYDGHDRNGLNSCALESFISLPTLKNSSYLNVTSF